VSVVNLIRRLVIGSKRAVCSHEFLLDDLERTGLAEPQKPTSRDCKDWEKYLDELWYGDWRKFVVRWPCRKCGKVFKAFCGLDIAPKHGRIVPR
jgi:hypothetical protein